jgi:3-keto-5-aminohexanoate cleavage enzyme
VSNKRPVVIEAALNGGTTPERNIHVPISTSELIADALACIEAGAAVVHTHATDVRALPEQATELYCEHFLPVLEKYPDALLYPTVVFDAKIEDRVGHLPLLKAKGGLRIGLFEPGSGSFIGGDDQGMPLPIDHVYTNSPTEIAYMAETCIKHQLGASMVIFEPGFLRHALAYYRAGRLPQGTFARLTFCGESSYRGGDAIDYLSGMPATTWALDTYLNMLGDADIPWMLSVMSGDALNGELAAYTLQRGGHLRVGLEDYAGPGQPTNCELVEKAVALVENSGCRVATAKEAAEILKLPQ